MTEIFTIEEVAALLRISKRHVYELTQTRTKSGDIRKKPLPCVKFGTCVRFRKDGLEEWLNENNRSV